jgi:hypothetical protein
MPTMTLQRAAQVFNRIKAETAFSTGPDEDDPYAYRRRGKPPTKNTFNLSVTLSVDGPVVQQAEAYQRAALGKKDQMFTLMSIGTRVRVAMGKKQADSGVSALVTERVEIAQKIKILEHILDAIETSVLNSGLLSEQAEAIKLRMGSTMARETTAQVSTSVLTDDDRQALTADLRAWRSHLMGIDDKLAGLNATNSITVTDEDFKILQEAGLA